MRNQWKSPMIIKNWGIFHCHVWLLDGSSSCFYPDCSTRKAGKNAIKIQLAQVENRVGSYITCVEQLAHSQSSTFWHSSTTLGTLAALCPHIDATFKTSWLAPLPTDMFDAIVGIWNAFGLLLQTVLRDKGGPTIGDSGLWASAAWWGSRMPWISTRIDIAHLHLQLRQ